MVCGASLRRADLCVLNRKADPMKRCFCYLLALVLGALAVGGLVFALLRSGVLTLTAGSSAALLFFAAAAAADAPASFKVAFIDELFRATPEAVAGNSIEIQEA